MANLSHTDLHEADLSGANLGHADRRWAHLGHANLWWANLGGADFTEALLSGTNFANVDVSVATGLETIEHEGPSTIDIDTIYKSKGKISEVFLRGYGVPESAR